MLEFGGSHFNKVVPNGRTNYCERFVKTVPPSAMKSVSFQQDKNSKSNVAHGSNLVTFASRDEKKLKMRQNESQRRIQNMTPQTYYMNGDTVGVSMQVGSYLLPKFGNYFDLKEVEQKTKNHQLLSSAGPI